MVSKFERRQFFLKFGQLSAGLVASQVLPVQKMFAGHLKTVAMQPFSIIQGLTTQTETQITIDTPSDMEVSFRLLDLDSQTIIAPVQHREKILNTNPWSVHFVKFQNLILGCQYQLQVLSKEGTVLDQRFLKTLDLDKANPRVAFISCARDIVENVDIWANVYKAKPDLLVFMGDNVYGDLFVIPSPKALAKRYIEARSRIAFYHNTHLIPVVAIWDDHDFGSNNSNGNYAHKNHALEMFNSFYGREDIAGVSEQGPGVSSCFRAFGIQFLMLDDRYFRSSKKDKNGSLFGDVQTNWAFDRLREFDGPTWMIQGNQFFGEFNVGSESFEGTFKKGFHHFLDGVRDTGKTVMFAGGDVHHSETMQIEKDFLGYETCELTSSGIHSKSSSTIASNKRRRQATPKRNFVVVDHNFRNESIELGFISIDKNSKVQFADQISVAMK